MITEILEERAELHTMRELVDFEKTPGLADDFEYIHEEEWDEPRILVLELGNDVAYFDALDTMHANDPEWDAYIDDTFFSRFVLKFLEGDDDGFVRVGLQKA